jgi:hypothetical protein
VKGTEGLEVGGGKSKKGRFETIYGRFRSPYHRMSLQ